MPFINTLTEADLSVLSDETKTSKDLCEHFSVGPATITRTLKALGIKKKTGSKKGVSKPKPDNQKQVACKTCGKEETVALTRNYTYCSRACMHACDDYKAKLSNMDKSYMQTEAYKDTLRNPATPEFVRYRNEVHRKTAKVYAYNEQYINPENYPRTLNGVDGGYQLDHIIPIKYGFDNGISPDALSIKENLRMLPWEENLARAKKNDEAKYDAAMERARYLISNGYVDGDINEDNIMKLASKIVGEQNQE